MHTLEFGQFSYNSAVQRLLVKIRYLFKAGSHTSVMFPIQLCFHFCKGQPLSHPLIFFFTDCKKGVIMTMSLLRAGFCGICCNSAEFVRQSCSTICLRSATVYNLTLPSPASPCDSSALCMLCVVLVLCCFISFIGF